MVEELSYEELDGYVRQVCTGMKLVHIENMRREEVPLIFKYPTSRDYVIADLVQRTALAAAQAEGLPSIAEMESVVRARGIFTEEDEDKIKRLRSRVEGQRAILAKTTRVPARRDRLKGVISNLEQEIEAILLRREASFEMTAERKAAEERFLFLTRSGVFDPFTDDLYWPTEKKFAEEIDFGFRKRIFLEYVVFSHGISQRITRSVARSNLWRVRYVTAIKTGEPLFGHPISEYNVDQLTLLYWSHFYQSIYEMLPSDRPPDNIIEDDQALDAYMKDWHADRNRDAAAERAKSGNKYGQNSAWDHGETFVMKSNPMHADIEYSETIAEKGTAGKSTVVDAAPINRSKKEKAR